MPLFDKEISQLTKADIDLLIQNKTREQRSLDYKAELKFDMAEEKKEFLADISSFANSAGGLIFFGIRERREGNKGTGEPEEATGLAGIQATDSLFVRLDQIIRANVAPRIPKVTFHEIPGFANGPVIVAEVGFSWSSPHMVTLNDWNRFYSRGTAGKFIMDLHQIKHAFLNTDISKQAKAFHHARVAEVQSEEIYRFPYNGRIVMHLIPLSAIQGSETYDMSAILDAAQVVPPLSISSGFNNRINIDGFVTYCTDGASNPKLLRTLSYAQFFRNGIVEAVSSRTFGMDNQVVSPGYFEESILNGTKAFLAAQKKIGVPVPIVILITILGLKGREFHRPFPIGLAPTFDRNQFLLPDVTIEDYDSNVELALKEIFDAFHQAAGATGSPNFDQNGKWIKPRS